jgi:hypothetical protein
MNFNLRSLPLYLFALTTCFHSCTCSKKLYEPVRSDEFRGDNSAEVRYKSDEILVMYKGVPTEAQRDTIRKALQEAGITPDSIKTCNSCNAYVELWQAADIHTVIHDEGIRAGTVSGGSKGVGEDSIARYSLNYILHLPVEPLPTIRQYRFRDMPPPMSGTGKDTIIIAVLDTGIDTMRVVRGKYLWRNRGEQVASPADDDSNCYDNDVFGWNFVNGSSQVHDDNLSLHGTLVSQYILAEFGSLAGNFPQIMSLKTHDHQGRGDLFSAICALHYAMDKGANIINASWGFYYYHDQTHPYLDSLITNVLKEKGILFVTASGNKIDQVDAYAQTVYQNEHGVTLPDSLLRNLDIHNFYPACLAEDVNNVMVATTTDANRITPTQNYASRFVDFGVVADTITPTFMKFRVPFTTDDLYISGSSFATAILTGKIGALTDKSAYQAGLNKQDIISNINSGGTGVIQTSTSLEDRTLVRDGRYVKRE